jgi:hypothetical protein
MDVAPAIPMVPPESHPPLPEKITSWIAKACRTKTNVSGGSAQFKEYLDHACTAAADEPNAAWVISQIAKCMRQFKSNSPATAK